MSKHPVPVHETRTPWRKGQFQASGGHEQDELGPFATTTTKMIQEDLRCVRGHGGQDKGDYLRHQRNNCSVNRGAILNSLVRSDTENKYRLPSEVARATTHYFEK